MLMAPPLCDINLHYARRPRLKFHMEYCAAHPEELTKVAAVQKKARFSGQLPPSALFDALVLDFRRLWRCTG